jgi:hypothetical protein
MSVFKELLITELPRHLRPAAVQVFLEVQQLGHPRIVTISVGEGR